jgi:hypothetical protein
MKTVIKPWGKEEWLELNDRYCYKRIYLNKGYKTSFQYHHFKYETNYIISGEAEIWLENDEGIVEKKIIKAGEYYNVSPPKKHRVIAITDLIMQEVSTPEVDDVFRIDYEFGRNDGRIEGEHKNPAVLILAAGLGTRLKNLTENINKTLLPINNKAIISHIINMFPTTYDFVLALGYKKDSIKEYCEITYPNHNFIFVDVSKFEGEGTGPGFSALECREHLQRPFYFVTGDCLIDSKLPHLDGNWLGVSPTSFPEKYSTIKTDEKDNVLSHINKDVNGHDLAFIGLGSIFDYNVFWNELEKNIKNGELVCAFENPNNYPTLKIKKLKWLDTGNLDDLNNTKQYFKDKPLSLVKKTSEIVYKDKNKFLKFIPNSTSLKNRVERTIHLKDFIPNNFMSTTNFISYDWNDGACPYELDDINVFNNFLPILKDNISKSKIPTRIGDIRKFYKEKTEKRVESFLSKHSKDFYDTEHEINGIKRKSLKSIIGDFNYDVFNDNDFYTLFHGDLHFDNMIYNEKENKYYYIDWRESFGDSTDAGDVYYDLAKFYGGLCIPYNLMKDEDKINYNEGMYSINYNYPVSENINKFRKTYEEWVVQNGFSLSKVKLITAIIFLNMSPLHDGKFGKMLWFKSIEMFGEYDK